MRIAVHSIDGNEGRVCPYTGVRYELLAGLGVLSPTTRPHIVVASGHTTIRQSAAGYVAVARATDYLASRGIRGVCVPVPYPHRSRAWPVLIETHWRIPLKRKRRLVCWYTKLRGANSAT